jgi:hypothetical protein
MSRGHGTLQRRLLELLDETAPDGFSTTLTLAAAAFDCEVRDCDRAKVQSTYRALRRLATEGLVEQYGERGWSFIGWRSTRLGPRTTFPTFYEAHRRSNSYSKDSPPYGHGAVGES